MNKKCPKKSTLTPKQSMFCKEYLIDLNNTQAAIRAGYSKKTANEQGARLLAKASVQAEIQKGLKKRTDKLEITVERVENELAKMSFSNMLDYIQVTNDGLATVDFSTLTREQAAAIQEVTIDQYVDKTEGEGGKVVNKIKFKLADKKASLELLGRRLKMFTDKLEVEVGDELKEALKNSNPENLKALLCNLK